MNSEFPASLITRLAYLPRTLGLIWRAAGPWTATWAALLIIQGLIPVGIVSLTRPLLDTLTTAVAEGPGGPAFTQVVWIAATIGGLMGLAMLAEKLAGWVHGAQGELVQDYISDLVHQKSATIDLAFYDSAEYFDRLHRARDESDDRPLELLESIGETVQHSVTLAGMALVLFSYGPWVPLALALTTAPALLIVVRSQRDFFTWWNEATVDRRWGHYYSTMLTESRSAPELRLFGLGEVFRSAYNGRRARLRDQYVRLTRRHMRNQILTALFTLVIAGGSVGWMIWRALLGAVTLGDVVLFYQAFDRGQSLMRSLLGNLGQIYGNSLFLSNLYEFLDLRPTLPEPEQPAPIPPGPREAITFRDVTFRYPGSERLAMERFSLTIPAGKVVAVVGPNGAGKSTLVKLMCRFYDPEGGAIEIDGQDIRSFRLDDLRGLVTVLFQQHVAYHATASDNIAMGAPPGSVDQAAIEEAARGAGAHEVIARLPAGYATLLGKDFANGTDLSGGEWQRLALARAFLRRSPILLLDEPTSFMDSWAETEWLDRFRALVRGRTALIITHRFTTAMRADIIHVVEQGRVVESGSHAELLTRGGIYAQSWEAQMRASLEGQQA